jgi:HEAT repeat protein
VVIKRSSSADVSRLLAEVGGGHELTRETAIARLAIIGTRAVERVVTALESAAPEAAVALLTVLERVGDPRALAPSRRALAQADDRLAAAAVAVLRRLLTADARETSTAALDALAGTVLDATRSDLVRGAALDALHDLPDEVVAPLRARLARDPSPQIRRQAGWPLTWPDTEAEAAASLPARPAGPEATPPAHPTLEAWAEGTLPDRPDHLEEALDRTGHAVPLPVLHRLVVAVRAREATEGLQTDAAAWRQARAALHLALARRGSRVALYDLRETLESHAAAVPSACFTAAGRIGDASCLEALAERATRGTDHEQRTQALDALRHIQRRERLTRRHALVKRLAARYPAVFAG